MRSIIDEIATAEEKAEQIRLEAATQARDMTAQAREMAEKALLEAVKSEQIKTETELEQSRLLGEKAAKDAAASFDREAEELCARAEGKIGRAVDYLVEKVMQTA